MSQIEEARHVVGSPLPYVKTTAYIKHISIPCREGVRAQGFGGEQRIATLHTMEPCETVIELDYEVLITFSRGH